MNHIVLSLLIASVALAADPTVKHVNAAEAAKIVAAAQVQVLDVRTEAEYQIAHIKGATNVDFKAADFATKVAMLDKSKPWLVHCASGGRSTAALGTLTQLGFTHLTHLDGGLLAWEEGGHPLVK
jgi:phage shock protein E